MAPLISYQPFRGVYTACFLTVACPYLAFYSLYYAVPSLRPISGWSYKMSLGAAVVRVYFRYLTALRYQMPPQLEPKGCKDRFTLVQPPDVKLFCNALSPETSGVQPFPVGVVWHPAPVQRNERGSGRKVCLVLAGGAFVLGWDPEALGRAAWDILGSRFGATNVLYVQYRLAGPETPFPAAVQDVLTSYHHVLSLGVPSEDIYLVGDSAGANIVLGFLRHLETPNARLPRPGGALVFSPWVEVRPDAGEQFEQTEVAQTDILIPPLLDWGANAYMPDGEFQEEARPYVSPYGHPFKCKTPFFIHWGAQEAFNASLRGFAQEMAKVPGNRVKAHESDGMLHDFYTVRQIMGLEEEFGAILEEAASFLASNPPVV
ncbi:alpha/beta hydrolase fold-3 domain-containing protein [Xylariomycetidae sp. FL0641]|nr:alpha/beta hydrolase fold-3 domain-containing protein [Xylariomycetidae sp. FL0641]